MKAKIFLTLQMLKLYISRKPRNKPELNDDIKPWRSIWMTVDNPTKNAEFICKYSLSLP